MDKVDKTQQSSKEPHLLAEKLKLQKKSWIELKAAFGFDKDRLY